MGIEINVRRKLILDIDEIMEIFDCLNNAVLFDDRNTVEVDITVKNYVVPKDLPGITLWFLVETTVRNLIILVKRMIKMDVYIANSKIIVSLYQN